MWRRAAFYRSRRRVWRASSSQPASSGPSSAAALARGGSSTAPRPAPRSPAILILQFGCSRSLPRDACSQQANTALVSLRNMASIRHASSLPLLRAAATAREWPSAKPRRRRTRSTSTSSGGRSSICCHATWAKNGSSRAIWLSAARSLLLPVSIAQVWAIEIVSRGTLYRFERDPTGLWFHHVGQHVHTPGGFVHHADPKLAPLIEAELAVLDRLPVARDCRPASRRGGARRRRPRASGDDPAALQPRFCRSGRARRAGEHRGSTAPIAMPGSSRATHW